jgi:hypothetical protein
LPAGQTRHVPAPITVEYLPAGHESQPPEAVQTSPGEHVHSKHAEAPGAENVPSPQVLHDASATASFARTLNLPVVQFVHAPCPAPIWNLPPGQALGEKEEKEGETKC